MSRLYDIGRQRFARYALPKHDVAALRCELGERIPGNGVEKAIHVLGRTNLPPKTVEYTWNRIFSQELVSPELVEMGPTLKLEPTHPVKVARLALDSLASHRPAHDRETEAIQRGGGFRKADAAA